MAPLPASPECSEREQDSTALAAAFHRAGEMLDAEAAELEAEGAS
jgi:hypothetical protein